MKRCVHLLILGASFLKTIAVKRSHTAQLDRKNPWQESLGEYIRLQLAFEYLKENIDQDVYSGGSDI